MLVGTFQRELLIIHFWIMEKLLEEHRFARSFGVTMRIWKKVNQTCE